MKKSIQKLFEKLFVKFSNFLSDSLAVQTGKILNLPPKSPKRKETKESK